jgi:predicted MFS family arabinose efflux permease
VSASVFAMLTYLVIYIQNLLGYTAFQAGLRFLPLTGGIFLVAGIAGRLTTKVPIRALIGTGFALTTAGLLLMRGLTPTDSWTHFLPGFIIAGAGVGLINVPLASTAVGVVAPERAGMASGINSTFRQVGIATGVAALGTILASQLRSQVVVHLAHTPLAAHAHALGEQISTGAVAHAIDSQPPALRGLVAGAARASYATALNELLLIAACITAVATVVTFVTIRARDFHAAAAPDGAGDGAVAEPALVA